MLYRTDSNGNLIKIAGNTNGTYGGNALPVGSIFSSAIPQTSSNYHLLNGDSLSIDGLYSGFYNLITTLVSQGYNLTCTADEYAEDIAKTGNCGKFVINTSASAITGTYTDSQDSTITATITINAESFKLPTITMFIQGLSNLTNIGDSLQAGLPNITGKVVLIEPKSSWSSSYSNTGPFKTGSQWNVIANNSSSYDGYGTGTFDASRISSIYGNSTTVQPSSTQYPYYIVLISGSALNVQANPTLSGSEQNLTSIGIGGVNYKTKVDYSTDEVNTGVKWIDGKTIYRKVINMGSLPVANQEKNVAHNINDLDYIVKLSGIAKNPSSNYYQILPFITDSIVVQLYANNTNISYYSSSDMSRYTISYVTIEYTKTTD